MLPSFRRPIKSNTLWIRQSIRPTRLSPQTRVLGLPPCLTWNPGMGTPYLVRAIFWLTLLSDTGQDLIIPLRSDTAFLCLLTSALSSLSDHFSKLHSEFTSSLSALAVSISSNARPVSSSSPHSFSAYLLSTGNVTTVRPGSMGTSDLYFWRDVFQLYIETEIFEDIGEVHRGERDAEEAKRRLALFSQRVAEKRRLSKLSGSKEALQVFFKINTFILDVKKVCIPCHY